MKSPDSTFAFFIVEDNGTIREGIVTVVRELGHATREFASAEAALDHGLETSGDFLITDYKLPGLNGIELISRVRMKRPQMETLVITAYGSVELAVAAMQSGASDFLAKPFSPDELTLKINLLISRLRQKRELQRISEENRYLREQVDVEFNYGEIIGQSKAMQAVYRTIEKVAPGDSSVIIYGESGTGKELVARAIHKASARAERPFIKVNCGALAEGVLESELFGHERGAFTGAHKRKKGRFELAHQGSIFLDEIGDLPLATQVKLLRVLQEKEFERVGGEETLQIDVRVIAATNKDLQTEISQGRFREDLFYRLHIIPIYLPPLRERKDDIPLLTRYFLNKIGADLKRGKLTMSPSAVARLESYDWPGNVREFENVIERAAVLCDNNCIDAADLPLLSTRAVESSVPQEGLRNAGLNARLEAVEKQMLQDAMQNAHGVKTEAAKLLGIKTSALYYKLEKYGLI